jgi:hypothetical protein
MVIKDILFMVKESKYIEWVKDGSGDANFLY